MTTPRDTPWRAGTDYTALAFVLHTDRDTAKRWFHAWAWRVKDSYLENVLRDGLYG